MKKQNEGITLVALVITIIILLILAGITINLTIGQRGILNRAQEAGRNYQEAAKTENEQLSNFLKEADDIIDEINGKSKPLTQNALAKKVEIGDYVAYDPRAGVTDISKLSYTSPVGTGSSHGNGHTDIAGGQTFTATSNTKWRVLSKDETTGEVILISETPINTDTGVGFSMYGAIGYLYAEQELNEICKIYGYGKRANTGKVFEYETGDILDETEDINGNKVTGMSKGTITGSGARSINVEDINKIIKYNPSTFTFENSGTTYGYGDESTHTIFCPTKTTENGASISAVERTDKFTAYIYQGSQYLTDTTNTMYEMLFGNNSDLAYRIASRGVYAISSGTDFGSFVVREGNIRTNVLFGGTLDGLYGNGNTLAVRPIVYLESNIQTNAKDENGAWIISE